MQHWFYLLGLLVSISGLLVIDYRFKLAMWHNTRLALTTIACGVAIFIVWDLIGIGTGIFFKGTGEYMLPFELLPEFPIEELFFLFLLCYVTLLLYRGFGRWQRIS